VERILLSFFHNDMHVLDIDKYPYLYIGFQSVSAVRSHWTRLGAGGAFWQPVMLL
jgi:hypothetical protein